LTVAFVNAGFMSLRQAIGVIMGANVGTTVTAFIIGFDIGAYSLPIMAIGSFMLFFFDKEKVNAIGQAVFGFGALFFVLDLMSSAMKHVSALDSFQQLTLDMNTYTIVELVICTILTLFFQSSSSTIDILQGMYGEDSMTLNAAIPVLFGDNLGTTITAILAELGSSVAAKREAFTHVIFNL